MKRLMQLVMSLVFYIMIRAEVVSPLKDSRSPRSLTSSRDPSTNILRPFEVESQPYYIHGAIDESISLKDDQAILPVESVSEVLTDILDELLVQIDPSVEMVSGALNHYFYQYIRVTISWFMEGGTIPFTDCLHILTDIRNHFNLQPLDHPISATVFHDLSVKMQITMSKSYFIQGRIYAGLMSVIAQYYPSRPLLEGDIRDVFKQMEVDFTAHLNGVVTPGSAESFESASGLVVLEMDFEENDSSPYPPFKYIELRSLMRELLRLYQSAHQWRAMEATIYHSYMEQITVVGEMRIVETTQLGDPLSGSKQLVPFTEFNETDNVAGVQTS